MMCLRLSSVLVCSAVLAFGCASGEGSPDGAAAGGASANTASGGSATGGSTPSLGGSVNGNTGGAPNSGSGGSQAPASGGSPNVEPPPGSYKVCTPAPKADAASVEIGTEGDGMHTVGQQGLFDSPELTANPALPQGRMVEFTLQSTASTIYPGINGAYSRRVRVWVPAQYQAGTPAPFMVTTDGYDFDLPGVLTNYIPGKCLPPMIGIFVDNGGGDAPGSQRGLEYDTVSDAFGRFLIEEVFPRVEQEANVVLTTDPEGGGIMGTSSGAAGAFTAAWFHPNRFRRVISYSGTFVNLQSGQDEQSRAAVQQYPHGAWEYHERLIAQTEVKPLRTWLLRGEYDSIIETNGQPRLRDGVPLDWQAANDAMYRELSAKGYHVSYSIALASGHSDGAAHGSTFPEAMLWTWRGYPIE